MVAYNSFAQTDTLDLSTEGVLENLLQEPGEEEDHSNFYDDIEQFLLNPIILNKAEISDLLQIPEMDYHSAELIINHRNKYGKFFSTDELNSVQGLDNDLMKKIKPFITIERTDIKPPTDQQDERVSSPILSKVETLSRSRISSDLQLRKGFIENKFAGTKPKIYNRVILKYNKQYQFGFLTEKDAGETDINDFQSYHFSVQDIGILNNLILGDYLVEFGQGLVTWNPYSVTKGTDISYLFRNRKRISKPYTSSSESKYLHGVLASFKLSDLFLTGFYSNAKIDAALDTISNSITSLPIDGLHRAESELQKSDKVKEKLWGARIDYSLSNQFQIGLLFLNSDFSNSFQPDGIFEKKGRNFNYYTTYYNLIINKINIFGEIAYNGTSVASLNSLQIFLGNNLRFVTSIRNYPRNYISLHGNAFGERSGATNNEFGIFTGLKWRTSIGIINFYYDQFKFPFATYSNPIPSTGDEFLINYSFKPFPKFETTLRYKYEKKEINTAIENHNQLVKRIKQQPKFELIFYPTKQLRLKGRFEYNSYRIPDLKLKEEGYLFFQDIRFSPLYDFNIYARIVFFSTDSFNSAIYQFENDLNGVMTNRPLYGEGIRWYIITKYKPFANIVFSLKYSETYKPDEDIIGSGLNEINGNLDNYISFQIDFKY